MQVHFSGSLLVLQICSQTLIIYKNQKFWDIEQKVLDSVRNDPAQLLKSNVSQIWNVFQKTSPHYNKKVILTLKRACLPINWSLNSQTEQAPFQPEFKTKNFIKATRQVAKSENKSRHWKYLPFLFSNLPFERIRAMDSASIGFSATIKTATISSYRIIVGLEKQLCSQICSENR